MSDTVKTPCKGPQQEKLLAKAKSLPTGPGCYLMKAKDDEVLYVGKAKNLKARVVTYFNESSKALKTIHMVEKVRDFDFIIAGNEAEALIIEHNLIKKHSPRYNIRLRDDKSYPYVVIALGESFPTFRYLRRPKRNDPKTLVFGPFPNAGEVSEVLRLMIKCFGLRDCSLQEFNSRREPCLLYQMKQCTAPCRQLVGKKEYDELMQSALAFFQGAPDKTIDHLKQRMLAFAQTEAFEHAAFIRDSLPLLEKFVLAEKQTNAELDGLHKDIDILAYHVGEIEVDISLYLVRNNLLLGSKAFHFPLADCQEEIEMELIRFALQYYAETHDSLPVAIVTDLSAPATTLFQVGVSKVCDAPIEVFSPKIAYPELFRLASEHAREGQRIRVLNEEGPFVGLGFLQNLLHLKERPKRLECIDIAIWQGERPTAGIVVFEEGRPVKKDYRFYHLTARPEGNNDFAFMREALAKRFEKRHYPDVFVLDGGKGQLSQFVSLLEEYKLSIPVVALAKERGGDVVKQERIFIPGRSNPLPLIKSRALMKILVFMRDEAHRFSRKLHHHAFHKDRLGGWLDGIEGIGAKAKQKIIQRLEMSVTELRQLSALELCNLFDLDHRQAQNLYDRLQKLSL
ncbi:MAG: excinuclease ABC subunit UvrC [Bdellovibrio sp.]|nr:excinuclease ABC subunit UvrC [Bdellovibrio sp.]